MLDLYQIPYSRLSFVRVGDSWASSLDATSTEHKHSESLQKCEWSIYKTKYERNEIIAVSTIWQNKHKHKHKHNHKHKKYFT